MILIKDEEITYLRGEMLVKSLLRGIAMFNLVKLSIYITPDSLVLRGGAGTVLTTICFTITLNILFADNSPRVN